MYNENDKKSYFRRQHWEELPTYLENRITLFSHRGRMIQRLSSSSTIDHYSLYGAARKGKIIDV